MQIAVRRRLRVREATSSSGNGQLFRYLSVKRRLMTTRSVRKLSVKPPSMKEAIVFHPRFIESSFDAASRTAQVIIADQGMGNARDTHYYGGDTIQQAVNDKVFEGAQCYADHPGIDEDINRPERSVRDLCGYYYNTRIAQVRATDGTMVPALAATFKIQEGADWALNLVREAIAYNQRFPTQTYVGISINADGDVAPSTINGQSVNYVHKITRVFSADMVTKPARGGKFLSLVESASGARQSNKEQPMDIKLKEAAARLKDQIASGQIDEVDLKALVDATLKESTSSTTTNDLYESQVTFWNGLSEADQAAFKTLNEADQTAWSTSGDKGKVANWPAKEAFQPGNQQGTNNNQPQNNNNQQDDDDDDNTREAKAKAAKESGLPPWLTPGFKKGSKEAASQGAGNLTESDIRKQFPSLYESALREAKASVGTEVAALQKSNSELQAQQALRESVDIVKTKLAESDLPAFAATRLMHSLVGKMPAEMDALIEAESEYLKNVNIDGGKRVGGSGARTVTVRESDTGNTSLILAGMGD
jgi:hypothetical protein